MRFAHAFADSLEDELSAERPVPAFSRFPTIPRGVDPGLLALTRSEPRVDELDDPFGGLIPVGDEERFEEVEVLDSELLELVPESNGRRLAKLAIPYLRVPEAELAGQPLDPRCGFLLPHVDGRRTIREITAACLLPEGEVYELIWALLERKLVALTTQKDRGHGRR